MGAAIFPFTVSPGEYNPTNAEIKKYHELERQALEMKEKADADAAAKKSRRNERQMPRRGGSPEGKRGQKTRS